MAGPYIATIVLHEEAASSVLCLQCCVLHHCHLTHTSKDNVFADLSAKTMETDHKNTTSTQPSHTHTHTQSGDDTWGTTHLF